MAGLITLPLRVSIEATRLALRPLAAVGAVAIDLLDQLLSHRSEPIAPEHGAAPPPEATVFSGPAPAPEPGPPPPPVDEPEPIHVSEEPELVAESADPGATNGSGAEVRVEEPWDGYRRAKASEVIASLADLTREELAVVELYEATHRARKSVLAAVERELKIKSPPGQTP
jgi:hypothetical protein